jgi:uncharacterized protein YodC (DUF2158 family)
MTPSSNHQIERQQKPFTVGDKVLLNSGGPVMTIMAEKADSGNIVVSWEDRLELPKACVRRVCCDHALTSSPNSDDSGS